MHAGQIQGFFDIPVDNLFATPIFARHVKRRMKLNNLICVSPDVGGVFSDATLNILTSKNNPVTEVRFRDCFPISLSALSYDQQASETNYLTATVTFEYKLYDFADTNASRTSITTS